MIDLKVPSYELFLEEHVDSSSLRLIRIIEASSTQMELVYAGL